jgi:hypothetical protein
MAYVNEDGMIALWAAVIRLALYDYAEGYTNPKHPDAARFLEATGLLVNGAVKYGGLTRRKRTRHATDEAQACAQQ